MTITPVTPWSSKCSEVRCVGVLHPQAGRMPGLEFVPSRFEGLLVYEVWSSSLSHSRVLDLSFVYCLSGFVRC